MSDGLADTYCHVTNSASVRCLQESQKYWLSPSMDSDSQKAARQSSNDGVSVKSVRYDAMRVERR